MVTAKTFLIAAVMLLIFSIAAMSAPPKAKEVKQIADERPTAVTTEKREPVSRANAPAKESIPAQTETGSTAQVEIKPVFQIVPLPNTVAGQAAAYSIDWFVIASGGGSGTSTNYSMDGTIGQPATGAGASTNYALNSGYWQNFAPASCCITPRGDANNDGTNCNVLDLTFLVNRIFRGGPAAVCSQEADLDSNGTPSNVLDLTFAVNRIFRGGPPPGPC